MTTLIDDCLLLVFDNLDTVSLASAAQVCKRWESLVKRKLKPITCIRIKNSSFCPDQFMGKELISTNAAVIKSALHYIGHHIKFVELHSCPYNTIGFDDQGYIVDDFNLDDIVLVLANTCENIVELDIVNSYIDSQSRCEIFEQLFKSNANLKELFLHGNKLIMFPSCAFETVEQLIWEAVDMSEFKDFTMPFVNLKKFTLQVLNIYDDDEFESKMSLFLPQLNTVNSLTIILRDWIPSYSCKSLLSDIRDSTHLEELKIWNQLKDHHNRESDLDFDDDQINKLIESCPNLRVLKLDELGIGEVNMSSFLALSKLEELRISNLSFFSPEFLKGIESKQFEHLTTLQIFYDLEPLDFSGLGETIRKMPALKYLLVAELPEEKAVEFTCEVICTQVSYKDIIIVSSWRHKFQSFRLHNVADPPTRAEPLTLRIEDQGIDYRDEVYQFVRNSNSCSVDDDNSDGYEIDYRSRDTWVSLDVAWCECTMLHKEEEIAK